MALLFITEDEGELFARVNLAIDSVIIDIYYIMLYRSNDLKEQGGLGWDRFT